MWDLIGARFLGRGWAPQTGHQRLNEMPWTHLALQQWDTQWATDPSAGFRPRSQHPKAMDVEKEAEERAVEAKAADSHHTIPGEPVA